ncbi:MAG TPA: alpha/beta fold hydrolase [Acidobacteriota bacterium]|nr:alpha/beta fold hydrolase [Acidobacteriota bacterium]
MLSAPVLFLAVLQGPLQASPENRAADWSVTTLETSQPLDSTGRLGGVAVDQEGFVYVSNFWSKVWKVAPDGEVTLLSQAVRGSSGNAVDQDGNLLQASFADNRILRITPDGTASDFVTEGLNGPVGLTVDSNGNLYVCNCKGNSITKASPSGEAEVLARHPQMNCPNGITVGGDGALYVTNYNNDQVLRITPDGQADVFATIPDGNNAHIVFTRGRFYITKIASNKLYQINQDGSGIKWLAGSGELNLKDGPLREAGLATPNGIAVSADGSTLYFNTLEGKWKGEDPTRIVLRKIRLGDGAPLDKNEGNRPSSAAKHGFERIQIETGPLTFDALAAGAQEGELVLLLHGFPQTSYSFRHQIKALAQAGYRAVAPDQRGYSPGARPSEVAAYAMSQVVSDAVAMADKLGRQQFHLVGHDWGGAVAWVTATRFPDRVTSLTVLSTPHFAALQSALAQPGSEQAKRSSYFEVFGAEGAEDRFLADDAAYLRSVFQSGGLTPQEIQVYVDALGTPEAMRAALNWYSALNLSQSAVSSAAAANPAPPSVPSIQVPTLYVWGSKDSAFARSSAEATRQYVAGPYQFEVLEGMSHWLPEQAAERVNELLLRHVRSHSPSGAQDR